MSHPAGSRQQQTRGKRALGLFVAVWLNLALAPCAMAMEAADGHPDDHTCPHCPPAEMQGHHGKHAGMQAEAPCAEDLSDCGLDQDFSHDVRGGLVQLKDTQYELPVFVGASELFASSPAPTRQRAPPPYDAGRLPPGPPLHLLNCVFLD